MPLLQAVSGCEWVRALVVFAEVLEQARTILHRRIQFLWVHAVLLVYLRRRLVRLVLALAGSGDWREGEVVHRLVRDQ